MQCLTFVWEDPGTRLFSFEETWAIRIPWSDTEIFENILKVLISLDFFGHIFHRLVEVQLKRNLSRHFQNGGVETRHNQANFTRYSFFETTTADR